MIDRNEFWRNDPLECICGTSIDVCKIEDGIEIFNCPDCNREYKIGGKQFVSYCPECNTQVVVCQDVDIAHTFHMECTNCGFCTTLQTHFDGH